MKKKPNKKRQKKTMNQSKYIYYGLMIISYLYLGFACMYKYIKYSSLDKCILELMLILTLSLIIEYVHIINNNGKSLRKSLSKEKEEKNRFKRYVGECFFLSLIITTVLFIAISTNRMYVNFYSLSLGTYGNISIIIVIMAILSFLDIFILTLIVNYTISEKLIKNHQK